MLLDRIIDCFMLDIVFVFFFKRGDRDNIRFIGWIMWIVDVCWCFDNFKFFIVIIVDLYVCVVMKFDIVLIFVIVELFNDYWWCGDGNEIIVKLR